jgi:hypothetical protein
LPIHRRAAGLGGDRSRRSIADSAERHTDVSVSVPLAQHTKSAVPYAEPAAIGTATLLPTVLWAFWGADPSVVERLIRADADASALRHGYRFRPAERVLRLATGLRSGADDSNADGGFAILGHELWDV